MPPTLSPSGVWQAVDVGFYIRELIPFGALNDIVENQHHAMVAAFENKNVLIFGLFVV